LVTTRLKNRWRAITREAWDITVGGAKPESSVMRWAPTAWPDSLSPRIDSLIVRSAWTGSCSPTGSGAIIAATRLPSAPRSTSARTLTGTIVFRIRPSVSTPRRRRWRPSAPVTVASITSLTVPPSSFLIALTSSSHTRTQLNRRCGPIGWL
jgi:hypothetical protein